MDDLHLQAAPASRWGGFVFRLLVFVVPAYALLGLPWVRDSLYPPWCQASAWLAGWLALMPGAVQGTVLQAQPGAFYIRVDPACTALDLGLGLVCAALAFPVSWRQRVLGALALVLAIQAVNVLRLALHYRLGLVAPDAEAWLHVHLIPPLMAVLAVGLFLIWTVRAQRVA